MLNLLHQLCEWCVFQRREKDRETQREAEKQRERERKRDRDEKEGENGAVQRGALNREILRGKRKKPFGSIPKTLTGLTFFLSQTSPESSGLPTLSEEKLNCVNSGVCVVFHMTTQPHKSPTQVFS